MLKEELRVSLNDDMDDEELFFSKMCSERLMSNIYSENSTK